MLKVSGILRKENLKARRKPPEGIYLNVPFMERSAASALGAEWDQQAKKWFALNLVMFKSCLSRWGG